jgi:hydroxyethylthiazole kinase-like sugar kinase family protein
VIIPNRSSISGSYVVDADCTGDISLILPGPMGTITSTSRFVIVRNGEDLLTINTGVGRVLTGIATKQHPRLW